jgi:hypothetical protein
MVRIILKGVPKINSFLKNYFSLSKQNIPSKINIYTREEM